MRRWPAGLLLACGLSALMHLVHPNPEAHVHDAPFLGGVRYAFNADSALFARLVVQFPQGFWNSEQGKVRILRPLYPALGRCVYLPLMPLAHLIPESWAARVQKLKTQTNHPEIWAGVDERSLLVGWAALIAVNFAVCWSSAALTLHALARILPGPQAFCLALLVLFHFDAVDFILVPHSEVFNLLVPAVTLDALTRGMGRTEPARATVFLLGVLQLGKALVFPVVNWLRGRRPLEILLLLVLFALPGAVYAAVLTAAGLPLYNHEIVVYRQGVWMLDYIRENRAGEIPWRWARGLVRHVANLALGFAVPFLASALLLLRKARQTAPAPWLLSPLLTYGLCCVAFWVLLGFDPPRMSIVHFPWVLVALGCVVSTRSARPVFVLTVVTALQVLSRLTGLYDV
jgi:hypothetical protein